MIKTKDWDGVYGWYEVTHLKKRDENKYSVMFVNSRKDTEKVLADSKDLVIYIQNKAD